MKKDGISIASFDMRAVRASSELWGDGRQGIGFGVQSNSSLEDDMAMSTVMPAAPSHDARVLVAFELSKAQWKVGIVLPQSRKMSRYTIPGGDTGALVTNRASYKDEG